MKAMLIFDLMPNDPCKKCPACATNSEWGDCVCQVTEQGIPGDPEKDERPKDCPIMFLGTDTDEDGIPYVIEDIHRDPDATLNGKPFKLYICDRKKCNPCNTWCNLTTDKSHAVKV